MRVLFNSVANAIKNRGLQFDKDTFARDVNDMLKYAQANEMRDVDERTRRTLCYPEIASTDGGIARASLNSMYEILLEFASGFNSNLYDYYKREYYEAEEGSTEERVYQYRIDEMEKMGNNRANGEKLYSKYFIDIMGGMRIDSMHIKVFLNALRGMPTNNRYNWNKANVGNFETNLAILYILMRIEEFYTKPYATEVIETGGKARKSEFEGFKLYLRKGYFYPNFRTVFGLEWTGCNQILADYVPSYTVPTGYKGYICDEPFVALACLISTVTNTDYDKAREILKTRDKGVLYNELSPAFEDENLRELISGRFGSFDSKIGKKIEEWYYTGGGKNGSLDFYDIQISELIQSKTAERIKIFKDDLEKSGVSANDCYIYWLSDTKFAVAIKADLPVTKVLPTLHKQLKPVPLPNYTYILNKSYKKL